MTEFVPFNDSWIQTPFSKNRGGIHLVFDENNPEELDRVVSEVAPLDIVYSLARIQRFHGFVGQGVKQYAEGVEFANPEAAIAALFDDHLYPVAEHTVLVSRLVEKIYGPEYAWEGLHHDDPEAYFGDMARPLKINCPDYRYHLRRFERYVMPKVFGVPAEMSAAVKDIDNRLLWTEALDMFGAPNVNWYGGRQPEPIKGVSFTYMTPGQAARAYIERYEELAAGRRKQGLLAPRLF